MSTNSSRQPLDRATVFVEYGYSAPEADINVGAKVEIVAIYIGGFLVDPSCFSASQLETWEQAIAEEVASDAQSDDEYRDELREAA